MALTGSPAGRLRPGSAARVVFVGATKKPNFVVETYKMPGPDFPLKEGEILLKMLLATICEEDLDVLSINGPGSGTPPRVLGHEGVGEVISSRPGDPTMGNVRPGDRLIFSPWSGSCAQCPSCKESRFVRCPRSEKYGHHTLRDSANGPVIQGGTFASHLVLRQGTQVAVLPEGLPDALAAPVPCVLAPLMKVASAIEILPNKRVAVVQGASIRGAYACAVLRESGFDQVFCLDADVEALIHVSRFGGIPVQETRHLSTGSVNNRLPRPGPCKADVVVRLCESSPTCSPLPTALDLLRPEGTLVLAGGTSTSPRVTGTEYKNSADLCWDKVAQKDITVRGISGYDLSDLSSAVSFVHRTCSTYPYEALLSPLQGSLFDFPYALSIAKSNRHCRVPVLTS